jgi:hypothetical protein
MTHRFEKSATDYACGAVNLLLQRMEQHQQEHGGKMPRGFVLHPESSRMLNDEHYKRYGMPHNMQFAGLPVRVCTCGNSQAPDWLVTANAQWEIL